jgi:O-antigen ligase
MAEAKPVTGVGAGNFPVSSIHYLLAPGAIVRDDFIVDTPKVAHNIYLETWAELGLVGLALFLTIIGFCLACGLRGAWAFARAGDRTMELLSRTVVVGTVGMLAAAFFNSLQYLKPIWLMLALGPCLLAVARRESRAALERHG